MKEFDNNYALSILRRSGVLTVDMQEAFVRGNVERLCFANEKAVLLKHKCGDFMLWCSDTESGLDALDFADEEIYCCIGHGKFAVEAIKLRYPDFTIDPPCRQYCLAAREKNPLSGSVTIRPLRLDEAEIVLEHYAMAHDLEHIREKIRSCQIFGAEKDGVLAGFIGFHEEGSTGMLEVFPEFRRMGIGTELENYIQNYQLDRGWMPYGQVYLTNDASLSMQSKLGLAVSDDIIQWCLLEDED